MLQHEVIHVDDVGALILGTVAKQAIVELLICNEEVHLFTFSHLANVLLIVFVSSKCFLSQFSIKTFACKTFLIDSGMREVFIIEIVESAILLLNDVPEPMEILNVPILREINVWFWAYTLFRCFNTESRTTTFFKCVQFSMKSYCSIAN